MRGGAGERAGVFTVPEIPQASLSGSRRAGKDCRDAESEGEAAEEEQVDEDLFGKDEEDAEKSRKLKKVSAARASRRRRTWLRMRH